MMRLRIGIAAWGVLLLRCTGASAGPSTQPAAQAFPMAGMAASAPADWQQVSVDRDTVITRWISPGSTAASPAAMITVEFYRPHYPDAARCAAVFAQSWHGHVLEKTDTLGGEPAYRIAVDAAIKPDLEAAEGIVSIHEGHLFVIEASTTPDNPAHDALELVRQSWKWISIESPLNHLQFRDQPVTVLNNHVSINRPAAMTRVDTEHTSAMTGFHLRNNQTDRNEFTVYVQYLQAPPDGRFDLSRAEGDVEKQMSSRNHLTDAFVWRALPASTATRVLTAPLAHTVKNNTSWLIYSITSLDNKMILTTFSIYNPDEAAKATYQQLSEKILATVGVPN